MQKLKDVFSNFGLRLLKAILGFVIIIITSRYLNAAGRGDIAFFLTIIQFAQIAHDFIGGSTIANMVAEKGANLVVPLVSVWSIFIITVLSICNWFNLVNLPWIMVAYALSLIWLTAHFNYYQALNKIKLRNTLQLIVELIKLGLIISLLIFNNVTVTSVLWTYCISAWAVYIVSRIFLLKFYKLGWQNPSFKNPFLLKFGFVNQLAVLFQFFVYRQGIYFLEHYIGKAEAGIWSNVVLIADVIWIFANTFGMIAHAQIIQNKQSKKNVLVVQKYVNISFFGTFLVSLVICFIPSRIFGYIFGNEFTPMANLIKIILPGIIMFSMGTIIAHYMHGYNKFKILLGINFIAAIFQFVISYIGIYKYGMYAVAIAFSVSLIVQATLQYVYFSNQLKQKLKLNYMSMYRWLKLKIA